MLTPRLIFTCLVATCLAGCADAGGTATSESAVGNSATPATTQEVINTLASADPAQSQSMGGEIVSPSGDVWTDAELLAQAYFLLEVATREDALVAFSTNVPEADVSSCMAGAGFTYAEGGGPTGQADADPRYTLSAEEFATQYGLGITVIALGLGPEVQPTPAEEYAMSLPTGEQEAYLATLSGCSGATPERSAFSSSITNAIEKFKSIVEGDDRVVAAGAAWSTCMSTGGFAFATPAAMRADYYDKAFSGAATQALLDEEKAVARANLECEPPYRAAYRSVVVDRFDEFKAALVAAMG